MLELKSQLYLAEIVVAGAVARKESRGSHFRIDYMKRDDSQWLKHTIAEVDDDRIKLSYADVDVSEYEPRERTY